MLSNYLLYPVLELKGFILFSLGVMAFLTVFSLFIMGRKKYGIKDFGWQASFFCLNNRELFGVVLGISQACFVFSSILSSRKFFSLHLPLNEGCRLDISH